MLEASLTGVLKTVLIVLLVYFGLKILLRFFGPLILKWFMKKMGQKFEKQFNQQFGGAQRPQDKEGKVSIDKKPKNGKQSNKNVGEYIDYEEID
ncbi:DUF4834 family protein [Gramella sp. MT6]|uniref:Uncharacterized protein DUF4834 n=1 Tax=Christiangramia gaetbulicola TaxID=703340 RepID=A0A2T6AGI6_9FLAO|nr:MULTISPECIES: DUF4834 family protein [Christiangramia]PTX42925.1 uncharacterized protein DUF4834 [Christiangramia gaetbulicola]QYA26298.1 DUF4834 family protein [Gramella sp. MT6]